MTRPWVTVALASIALSATLAGWEAFAPHTHPPGELTASTDEDSLGEFLIVLGVISVCGLVVFGWVARRGLQKESAAWTALGLSVLGFLAIAAFWSGLPPVLAGGGILLGWASRNALRSRWAAWAAIGIGVFVLVADVAVYVQEKAF